MGDLLLYDSDSIHMIVTDSENGTINFFIPIALRKAKTHKCNGVK